MDKDIKDAFEVFVSVVDAYYKQNNTNEQVNKQANDNANNKAFAAMVDNNMKNIIGAENKDIDTYASIVSIVIENAKIIDAEKLKGVDLNNVFEFFTLIDYSINTLLTKLKSQLIKVYNESR